MNWSALFVESLHLFSSSCNSLGLMSLFSYLFGSSSAPAAAPACCPPESLPELPKPSGGRGVEITVDAETPLEVYVSNPLNDVKSVVVVASDVFGWRSGHHRRFADQLAARLGNGYAVVVPDLFHGSPLLQPMFENAGPVSFVLGVPGFLYLSLIHI